MSTVDFITDLFCQIDEHMSAIPKHPQAALWPRANALKLLSQQYLEQVVGIESAREALAGHALLAGLLA